MLCFNNTTTTTTTLSPCLSLSFLVYFLTFSLQLLFVAPQKGQEQEQQYLCVYGGDVCTCEYREHVWETCRGGSQWEGRRGQGSDEDCQGGMREHKMMGVGSKQFYRLYFLQERAPHTRTHRRLLLTTTKILSTSLLSVQLPASLDWALPR